MKKHVVVPTLYQIYDPSYDIHNTIFKDNEISLSVSVTTYNTTVSKHQYNVV